MIKDTVKLEGYQSKTLFQIFTRRFFKHKLAVASLVVLFLLYLLAILAPFITPYDFDAIDLKNSNTPPSLEHSMGTDELGRDELTRILYGGRISLMVGTVVALVASIIGTMIGVLSG